MNKQLILHTLSKMMIVEAALLFIPTIIALLYREYEGAQAFLATSVIILAVCIPLLFVRQPQTTALYAKEGFVIVGLIWILWSLAGALPFYISREIPAYIDCFFETVSGFTTTGSSILRNVEAMSRGMLFWRSFTHWIGGMGVLVFVMAILPLSDNHSIHLMRAEVPGPSVGKLVPKGKTTAKILYGIYVAMTLLEVTLLVAGKMPVFDSFIHAFGSAGTGGFGMKNNSIAYYNSAYIDYVIGIFMMLFGINFNIYFFLLIRKFTPVVRNTELKAYIGIIAATTLAVALSILPQYPTFSRAFRDAFFQVSSIITTTGFSTANFSLWPEFAKMILLLLMIVGACAGSTGGGLKVSRVTIMVRGMVREIRKLVHPKSVNAIHVDDKPVPPDMVNGVMVYLGIYMLVMCISLLLVSLNNFDLETTLTSVAACLNNIGPGIGDVVGPAGNFASLSVLSKLVLSADMLLGRLELIPLIILFNPSLWKNKFI